MKPTLQPAPARHRWHLTRAPGERYTLPPRPDASAAPLRGAWTRAETYPGGPAAWERDSLLTRREARLCLALLASSPGRPAAAPRSAGGRLIARALAAGVAGSRGALAARLAAVGEGRPIAGVRQALSRAALPEGVGRAAPLPGWMIEAVEGWMRDGRGAG